jgi:hypothetical protein
MSYSVSWGLSRWYSGTSALIKLYGLYHHYCYSCSHYFLWWCTHCQQQATMHKREQSNVNAVEENFLTRSAGGVWWYGTSLKWCYGMVIPYYHTTQISKSAAEITSNCSDLVCKFQWSRTIFSIPRGVSSFKYDTVRGQALLLWRTHLWQMLITRAFQRS